MQHVAKSLTASVVFAYAAVAQQASYTYIDQPPQYANNASWLTAQNRPVIGQTLRLMVETTFGGTRYLLTGFSNPRMDLAPFSGSPFGCVVPLFGSVLYSSGEVALLIAQGASPIVVPMPVPNSGALLGASFYQQVVEMVPGSCFSVPSYPPTVSLSRGGHGVIGI